MPTEKLVKFISYMEVGIPLAAALGNAKLPSLDRNSVPRWPFEVAQPMVSPELVKKLSTKMYKFHQWYMNKLVKDLDVFNMLVRPDDFFREGEKVIRMRFKDICEVYHLDARIPILSSPGVYKCLFIIYFLINSF